MAGAAAYWCDAANAISSGSSCSVSIRTPCRCAAAGDSITTAAANSCDATRRSDSGVTSSSKHTRSSEMPSSSAAMRAATGRLNGPYPTPSTPPSGCITRRASMIAPSISANARRDRSSNTTPAGVNSTRRIVRTNSINPISRSSSRIAREQRRLRHVQPRGRPPEMQLLGNRDEVAQLPQLDRRLHPTDTDPPSGCCARNTPPGLTPTAPCSSPIRALSGSRQLEQLPVRHRRSRRRRRRR